MALQIQNTDDFNLKVYQDYVNGWIAECDEYPNIAGVGDTKEEAVQIFYEHLKGWQELEKQGKLAKNKGGRPKKNNVALTVNISTEAKLYLSYYCIQNDIKPGEFINKMILDFKAQCN